MNNILATLGLCKASGNLVYGEKLINAITTKRISLVLLADDVAINNEKKITSKSKFYDIKLVRMFTKDEISHAIGTTNTVAVGILDKKLAEKILKQMEGSND